MSRHAYLIMAHNDFDLLKTLLGTLDDERNDIYLHIDKKAKEVPLQEIKVSVKFSSLTVLPSMSIRWGSYQQIQCEVNLMKIAFENGPYAYYHLLSGSDLPLKKQDYIHGFYDMHQGKEFIQFVDKKLIKECNCYERMKYYTFFQGYSKHNNKLIQVLYEIFNAISIHLQMLFRIDRIKHIDEKLAFGANWFSITNDLIEYVLSKDEWIKEHFQYTRCADEMFLQMLVYNSDFYEHVFQKQPSFSFDGDCIMRRIDWKRGNPYVFRITDQEELKQTMCLFARKFSSKVDTSIIQYVKKYLN